MCPSDREWMLSRREFVAVPALLTGAAVAGFAQKLPLTAGEVADRIKANLGVPSRGGAIDTFKAGDADTPVTGIATTVMSTFDVIKKAAAARLNMVITHEATFWTHSDNVQNFANDALYKEKFQFLRDNGMAVWRFHDHLHAKQPDMSTLGPAEAIGWSRYLRKDEPRVYVLPPVKLRDLAKDIERRLKLPAIRVVGDPQATVSRGGLMQGAPPFHAATMFANVDVIVAGEQREWEGVEYAFDAYTAGKRYRTVASREGRGLVGHSMGGYGTMRVGMKQPEAFAALYAMSSCCLMNDPGAGRGAAAGPRGDEAGRSGTPPAEGAAGGAATPPGNAPPRRGAAAGQGRGMANALSVQAAAWAPNPRNPPQFFDLPTTDGQIQPLVAAKWLANSPLVMVDQYVPALKSFRAIALDVADKDPFLSTNRQLADALTRLGVPNTFELYDGDHVNRVRERFESMVVPFFSRDFAGTAR